jgi:hypothetical protein
MSSRSNSGPPHQAFRCPSPEQATIRWGRLEATFGTASRPYSVRRADEAASGPGRQAIIHCGDILAFVAGERKQKARPRKGKPTQIPMPTRRGLMDALKRAALRRTSTSK